MIITFYNQRINPDVVESQKKVFNHFGLSLNQINFGEWLGHGRIIDNYLSNLTNDWEYLVLFDIDSIPLTKDIVPEAIDWAINNTGIFSVAQKASHIKDSIVYASPAFLAISRKTYELLGNPTFDQTYRSDCAGELTHAAIDKGFKVNLMYPSHVEKPMWDLDNGFKFGYGTTYADKIYHSFESRFNKTDIFLKKCNEILNG
jgi:hypothetical protein